ncbi:hypothetical protein BJF78_16800 [Pseudonocardia sp. CNS-139]|nr:hypothetical protein BJF78_16800 [Pseudonocardia sp. CNS-139]
MLWALSMPGVIFLLAAGAALRRTGPLRRGTRKRAAVTISLEEIDAFATGGKRIEIDARRSHSLMRDEERDGAPPRPVVDLDGGVVRFGPAPGA